MLKKILRSPAHYKAELESPTPPTAAQHLGTLIHLALLEPKKFQASVEVAPKFSGKGARLAAEQWKTDHQDKQILKAEDAAVINGILDSVSCHKSACELLNGGQAEESFFWQDPASGIVCKARPDLWKEGTIVDLKTTVNASPQDFPKAIANLQYHLQAAYYMDGVSAVLGEPIRNFTIIAIEKEPPYAVATYQLDEASLDVGRALYRRALNTLRRCRQSGFYPAYPDRILTASLPSWAWPVGNFAEEDYDFEFRPRAG
jgi:hypothetical protein